MNETRALAELNRWGKYPVQLDTTVCDLVALAEGLRLALRHPDFPTTSRAILTKHLDRWAEVIGRSSPPLGDLIRLGSDPAADVPVEDAP